MGRETLRDAVVPDGQVDVAMLTGKATLAGADVIAEAVRDGVARTYVPIGGAGHTTETFRARELLPEARFANDASEAEAFDAYLRVGWPPQALHPRSSPLRKAKPRQRRTKPRTFRNERLRDFAKQSDLEWRNVRGGPTDRSTKAPYASNPSVAAAMPAASSPK